MKYYKRIKLMLRILALITAGLLIYAKIDVSIFADNDFLKGFSEGFISSGLVALGILSIKIVFFNTEKAPENRSKLLWMVGASSFVGYLALNAISDNTNGHDIPVILLLIQSLIYYGLFAGKSITKKYSFR